MKKTTMFTTARIMDIFSGFLSVGGGFSGLLFFLACTNLDPNINLDILVWSSVSMIFLGALAIVGGIHPFKKKKWWLAITGAIASLCPTIILGIIAIIFTSLSKKEFT